MMICMLLVMQGCLTNDLDDCPDAVRYSLAFKYTLHTDGDDRFYEDVDKMLVYVFDAETGLCVYADTASMLAPFGENYTYPLPVNVGKYNIITWGWGRNSGDLSLKKSTVVVPVIVPGITSINDARLLLEEEICDGRIEKTFYGECFDVEIPAFISRIDTISLMNITNQIRIVIPDAKTAKMQDEISISITGDNGAYHFNPGNNTPGIDATKGAVTYKPYKMYRTDSILRYDPVYELEPYEGSGKDSMLIVEISSLRLVQNDNNMLIDIKWKNSTIKLSLLNLLQAGLASNVQYNLDKYYRWQLSYEVSSTSATAHIAVLDWRVVYIPSSAGGILQ